MVQVCAIASGSNGNCYYIANNEDAILVDAGISCKQILKRMSEKNLDLNKVKALFISHEHSDHIRGVDVFIKQTQIPIYMSKGTYNNSKLKLDKSLINFISDNSITEIGNLKVTAFSKIHDASEPLSFMIDNEGKLISVLTDIGEVCDNVKFAVQRSNVIFMESNYDKDMLDSGPYPYFLKQRISGGEGHLSNLQASALLMSHASSNLDLVLLSHLSDKNNDPNLALKAFDDIQHLREDLNYDLVITDRFDAIDPINLD